MFKRLNDCWACGALAAVIFWGLFWGVAFTTVPFKPHHAQISHQKPAIFK
jgi:hypothetical protein